MNVQQVLSLRKPVRKERNLTGGPGYHQSDVKSQASRFSQKKSNVKDILVRNFFKKYPMGRDLQDI